MPPHALLGRRIVPLHKDDIDAVSMMLRVDADPVFMVLLTRGGLTKRMGASEATDRGAQMVTGRTDSCFEEFMAFLPESLLDEGGSMEDGGRNGPRHEWQFEFGGGMNSVIWDIAYHWESASLPDEFADLVVQAERLTHAWYAAGVAEETGTPVASGAEAPPAPKARAAASSSQRPAATKRAPSAARGRVATGEGAPAPRERIALAVLLDLFVLGIPWAHLLTLVADGPPPLGLGLVIFAFVEFALLQFLRTSPGYWMLGISAPLGAYPRVDPSWPVRESRVTVAVGVVLFLGGARSLADWSLLAWPGQRFSMGFLAFLAVTFQVLLALGSVAAGALILRTDPRGVWVGGVATILGLALVLLSAGELTTMLEAREEVCWERCVGSSSRP